MRDKIINVNEIIVVDHFYNEPTKVRELALNLNYLKVSEGNVAAMQSVDPFYTRGLVEKIQDILQKKISFGQEQAAFGKFRIMDKDANARLHIHYDDHVWAGLIYLSPDEVSRGGTGFYWHKETGYSSPEDFGTPSWCGRAFDKEAFDELLVRDSKNLEAWELYHVVPFKFNRLVLFQGDQYFHGTYKRFGDTPRNARLTQNFFFDVSIR